MFSYLRNEHVLFGIHPTEPNTNYGYIKINYSNKFRMAGGCDTNFSSVKNFLEKPDIKTATRLLKTKNCYWNSGCFVLNKKVLIEDVQQYQQSAFAIASKMELKTMYDKKYLLLPSASDFAKLPNIAFDKAIIEKSQHLACCVANFDWCDIGSWKSIMLLIKQMNIRFD